MGGVRKDIGHLGIAAQALHVGCTIVQGIAVSTIGVEAQVAVGAVQQTRRTGHKQTVADIRVGVIGQDVAAGR